MESNALSQESLVAAQNDESRSLLEFQIARGKLHLLGLDDDAIKGVEKDEGEQLARLTLRSPIDGTVLEIDAEAGSLFEPKINLIRVAPSSAKESGPALFNHGASGAW